eukprot:758896-Hanusia_phi.AAC.1
MPPISHPPTLHILESFSISHHFSSHSLSVLYFTSLKHSGLLGSLALCGAEHAVALLTLGLGALVGSELTKELGGARATEQQSNIGRKRTLNGRAESEFVKAAKREEGAGRGTEEGGEEEEEENRERSDGTRLSLPFLSNSIPLLSRGETPAISRITSRTNLTFLVALCHDKVTRCCQLARREDKRERRRKRREVAKGYIQQEH